MSYFNAQRACKPGLGTADQGRPSTYPLSQFRGRVNNVFGPLTSCLIFGVQSTAFHSTAATTPGATPLLKQVIAEEGDTVAVSDAGISVNGRLVPNTRPRATDTAGRPMPR